MKIVTNSLLFFFWLLQSYRNDRYIALILQMKHVFQHKTYETFGLYFSENVSSNEIG